MKFTSHIEHHTPMKALYDDHGKLIGYACEHCEEITTPSTQWSSWIKGFAVDGVTPTRNKAHQRRLRAYLEQR